MLGFNETGPNVLTIWSSHFKNNNEYDDLHYKGHYSMALVKILASAPMYAYVKFSSA